MHWYLISQLHDLVEITFRLPVFAPFDVEIVIFEVFIGNNFQIFSGNVPLNTYSKTNLGVASLDHKEKMSWA